MTTTPNLGITLVEQSQSQKEITINEAFARIDALLNSGAVDINNTPPSSPVAGEVHIVGITPTGAWAGQANAIVYYDQLWRFITPHTGVQLWLVSASQLYVFNGTTWVASTGGGSGMSAGVYDPAAIAQQLVGTTATQTLTNKTIISPLNAAGSASSTSVTFADVTGMSVNVVAGGVYSIKCCGVGVTNPSTGFKIGTGGTATYTSFHTFGTIDNGSLYVGGFQSASSGSLINLTNTTSFFFTIEGSFTVNAAGTLTVQFAQNVANSATVNLTACWLIMHRIA